MTSVFFLYRDSPLRRAALSASSGAPERYALYGLDDVSKAGVAVRHSLEPELEPKALSRGSARVLDAAVRRSGGYSGDFASVLACRRELSRADVVFSTVDTVGIPFALLRRAGVVRARVLYAAIGLPERLEELGTERARRVFREAYRRLEVIVAYGWGEVEALRAWLGDDEGRVVRFLPFGVDVAAFAPEAGREPGWDVVSVGADPRRDFALLVELARRRPELAFLLVTSVEHAAALGPTLTNLHVEVDVPLATVRDRLASARTVVLPVRDNTYSGATTVLLQAMAMAKPVVVTRTAAIARGYSLEDGLNVALVPPGDLHALDARVSALLADSQLALAMGARARETVERELTWDRYAEGIYELLVEAAGPSSVPV